MKMPFKKKSEDIWIYQLEPANAIAGFILAGIFTGFFIIFAMQKGMDLKTIHWFCYASGIAAILMLIARESELEINRGSRIIRTISKVLFFRRENVQSLSSFNSVRILPKAESAGDGYLKVIYALELSGPGSSQEVIITDSSEEAERHLAQLSEFLKLKTIKSS
jgi:hypothetical protein